MLLALQSLPCNAVACEPFCADACTELNGDVSAECGACEADKRCWPGSPDFRPRRPLCGSPPTAAAAVAFLHAATSDTTVDLAQLGCSTATPDGGCATLPTHLRAARRFAQAADSLLHLVVRNTTLQPGANYGNMAMHRAPPASIFVQPLNLDVERGQVVFIPRGWWHQ
eukprot:4995213-Prymnesium_polylepis.1